MGKEDLIVDNPLLLTSLFHKGIYVLPNEIRKVEPQEETEEVPLKSNSNLTKDNVEIQASQETENAESTPKKIEVDAQIEAEIPTEEIKHVPQNNPVIPELTQPLQKPEFRYPNVAVLHIVAEMGSSPYREQTIPNTMAALTKSGAQWGGSFEIIDYDQLGVSIMEYLKQAPKNMKIIFWGKETPYAQGWVRNTPRFMLLSMPSVMLATQESKAQHWTQIKAFFGI